eukprot:COSAG02_NODE_5591_length_4206_cov_3.054298_6_plen_47_part_00
MLYSSVGRSTAAEWCGGQDIQAAVFALYYKWKDLSYQGTRMDEPPN